MRVTDDGMFQGMARQQAGWRAWAALGLGASAALALLGCSESSDVRPPFLGDQDCEGPQCGPIVGNPNPPTGSIPPPGGERGDNGDGGSDAGVAEPLEAAVALASSADLTLTQRLDVPLSLRLARNPEVELARVNGSEPFTLTGERLPAWLTIRPLQAAEDIIPTTQWVTSEFSPQQMVVMDRVVLSDIGESLVLSPQAPNPVMGHALVTFVDPEGVPLPGVSVEASNGVVAYDLGATFTDATTQTDQRGSVAWVNASSDGPQRPQSLEVRYLESNRRVHLPIASDTVTLARVVLEPE